MMLTVNPEGIPQELKPFKHWMLWKSEPVEGREKPTKVPYQVNGRKAASTIPTTWIDFSTAVSAYQSKQFDGIGFAVTPDTPLAFDLDNCRCPAFADQEIEIVSDWARKIIDKADTYCEVSPSGRGIRGFAKAVIPVSGRKKGDFEIYQTARYVTVTGHHLPGTPTQIMERQAEIDAIFHEYFGPKEDKPEAEKMSPRSNMDAEELKRRMINSKNGSEIQELLNGNFVGYPSRSESDMALCGHLAFWCGNDSSLMEQIFRSSGLMRPKWDKRHHADGSTYGQETIRRAIAGNKQTYSGAQGHTGTTTGTTSETAWETPVLFGGVIETPEIPARLLPGILGEYCQAVAEHSQTPPAMAIAMALATVATCAQKRFEVAGQTHIEPINVWTVAGSDPATRKSAVVNGLTYPLSLWEKGQAEILKPEISKIQHTIDVNQERISGLKKKAAKAKDQSERDAMLLEIINIENTTPRPLTVPRLFTDDTTPEKLADLMMANQERMAIISDEGGTFEVLSGLYSNGKSNVNTYLKGHAGTFVRVDRKSGSVMLEKPALTFGLAVQPDVISGLADGSKAKLRGNGMLARFLYFMPKSTVGSRDVRSSYVIPETLKIQYQNLIFQLLNIAPVFDEKRKEQPRTLTLAPDALDAWLQFSEYIESRQGESRELCSIQDWSGKLPGAALRIAGLLHVAEHLDRTSVISLITIEHSLDLCELLIPHAKAAFDLMGTVQEINDAKTVFKWLHGVAGDRFTQRDAFRAHNTKFKKMERLKKALDILVERHIVSEPQTAHTGGRASVFHLINPMAREVQA